MSTQENKLYVGNLSYQVNEEGLNNFFETNGIAVQNVMILKDKYTDRSKGFGFVEVSSQEEVEKAIAALNGKELDGRTITVSQARAREERRPFSGPRGDRGGQKGRRGRGDSRGGNRGGGRFGKKQRRF